MYFDNFIFDENVNNMVGKVVNINEDGYIYGNMFKDEYKPYKDYKAYRLNPSSNEDILKLKIMEEQFIVTDLGLYLDVHPDDDDIYKHFKKHNELLNSYINEYENEYGSICLNSNFKEYNWIKNPWPWEMSK